MSNLRAFSNFLQYNLHPSRTNCTFLHALKMGISPHVHAGRPRSRPLMSASATFAATRPRPRGEGARVARRVRPRAYRGWKDGPPAAGGRGAHGEKGLDLARELVGVVGLDDEPRRARALSQDLELVGRAVRVQH